MRNASKHTPKQLSGSNSYSLPRYLPNSARPLNGLSVCGHRRWLPVSRYGPAQTQRVTTRMFLRFIAMDANMSEKRAAVSNTLCLGCWAGRSLSAGTPWAKAFALGGNSSISAVCGPFWTILRANRSPRSRSHARSKSGTLSGNAGAQSCNDGARLSI